MDVPETLHKRLDLQDLIAVEGHSKRLQREGKPPFEQQPDPPQAPLERSRHLGDRVELVRRQTVEADFDHLRGIGGEVVGDAPGDQRAVGEDRQPKAFPLGRGVDVQKVGAREGFAAGEGQLQAARLVQLVQDPDDLVVP